MSWEGPTLRTERLILRPLTSAHAEGFFALESDPEVVRYQTYGPQDLAQSQRYAQESEESWRSGPFPKWQEFALEHDGEFIGRIGFEHADGVATVWFALLPRVQGKGFATEALDAVMRYGGASGLRGFEANCAVKNVASANLMLRCGWEEIPSDDPEVRQFRATPPPPIRNSGPISPAPGAIT